MALGGRQPGELVGFDSGREVGQPDERERRLGRRGATLQDREPALRSAADYLGPDGRLADPRLAFEMEDARTRVQLVEEVVRRPQLLLAADHP